MSSIALSGSQIYISGFVFVFKDTFLDMCTMAKIKKHERENKMIACRSRPSPAHRTSPSGGSRRGGGGGRAPQDGGHPRPGSGVGGPRMSHRSSGVSKGSRGRFRRRRKKKKRNPKCQRNFSGLKFLHHLESISAAAGRAGPPWCPRSRGRPPRPGRWPRAAPLWTPCYLRTPGSSPSALQREEK